MVRITGTRYSDNIFFASHSFNGPLFTFQQDNPPAHRARKTVVLLSAETPTGLHRTTVLATEQPGSQSG